VRAARASAVNSLLVGFMEVQSSPSLVLSALVLSAFVVCQTSFAGEDYKTLF